jgi:hypothetical protein
MTSSFLLRLIVVLVESWRRDEIVKGIETRELRLAEVAGGVDSWPDNWISRDSRNGFLYFFLRIITQCSYGMCVLKHAILVEILEGQMVCRLSLTIFSIRCQ